MNNGTMFADLCNYTDYSYFKEHPTVVLETKGGVFAYSVFSVMKVKSDDDWYRFTTVGTEKSYKKINPYMTQEIHLFTVSRFLRCQLVTDTIVTTE